MPVFYHVFNEGSNKTATLDMQVGMHVNNMYFNVLLFCCSVIDACILISFVRLNWPQRLTWMQCKRICRY
jgi:hypothetical protein